MHFQSKFLPLLLIISACTVTPSNTEVEDTTPTLVDTSSRPTNKQWKGVWAFQDSTVFFSNDFEGARLNGLIEGESKQFLALITAENYPINPSPWYAFKVWSKEPKEISVQLTYDDSRSRYYPKISVDGISFSPLDSALVQSTQEGDTTGWGIGSVPESIRMTLRVSESPIWISAQELWASTHVKDWMDGLAEKDDIKQSKIGESTEGRPLWMQEIGAEGASQALLIISRQHPPEVTGFLAMKSFIETIAGESDLARAFRAKFKVFNIPLMNPDGVDNGNWRHNTGGIDLNRDWQSFHQPETRAVRTLLEQKTAEGVEFVFASDFHSTWQDIYYPLDSTVVEEDDLFIYDWINRISDEIDQVPNISASVHVTPTMVSRNYFYHTYGIPSIVFELGDNVKRDFIARKGEVAAIELMEILMEKSDLNK